MQAANALKAQLRSGTLIKCVYGFGMDDLSKLNNFEWDIFVEDILAREKGRIIKDIEYLINMYEHHELCSINNVFKYYVLLCKQNKIKKEYGVNIPRKIRENMQDELDTTLSFLDGIIIPGFEPEPTPKFTIGGVEVPESLGLKRENRGRKKGDILNSSALLDFYYLINYVETPVDVAEVEADRLIELERKNAKRGRGRPEGAKNKVKRVGKRTKVVKEKKEGETRGRKRGSKNIKATAESDKNVVIIDKEIVVRKNQTYFEQYLFKYSRENRDISTAQWMDHAEKELKKIMDSLRTSVKNFLNDWSDINSEEVFWLKKFLMFKTRFNETPYLEDHIRGWRDEDIVRDDGSLNRNGLNKVTIDTYRKFLKYCTNESAAVYINILISDESPSETLYATINEPAKIESNKKPRRFTFDPNALNIVYLPACEGEIESAKSKIISSVNGIPIMSEYVLKRSPVITSEMVESIKNIPNDKRVFLPKRLIVKRSKGKGKRQWRVKKDLNEDLSEDEDYDYNYVRLNEPVKSFISSMNDFPHSNESKPIIKNTVRHIPKVDDPIFGHMDKYVAREKYVPVKLIGEKSSAANPLKPFVYGSRVITIKEDMLKSKTFKKSYNNSVSSPKVNVYAPPTLNTGSLKFVPVNHPGEKIYSKSSVYTPPSLNPVIISKPVSIPTLNTCSKPLSIPKINNIVPPPLPNIITTRPLINSANLSGEGLNSRPTIVTPKPIINTVNFSPERLNPKPIIVTSKIHVEESIVANSYNNNSDEESVTDNSYVNDSEFDDLIDFNEELCTSSNSNDSDIDNFNHVHILDSNNGNVSNDDSSVILNECIEDDISEINNYDGEFLDCDLYDDLSDISDNDIEDNVHDNEVPDLINFNDDALNHDNSNVVSNEIINNGDLISFNDDFLIHDNLNIISDETISNDIDSDISDLINFDDDVLDYENIYNLYDDVSDNNSSLLDDNISNEDTFNALNIVDNHIEINIMENREVDILIDFSEKDMLYNMNGYNDFNKCLLIVYMEMLEEKLDH